MNKIAFSLALACGATVVAQCPIPGTGSSLMQNGVLVDGWTGFTTPIGFAFPFDGSTYTDMWLSDHGLCALNHAGSPAAPPAGAFLWDPLTTNLAAGGAPLLSPYWSDHSMFYTTVAGGNAGELWVDNTSGTYCTVTWKDVETYIDGAPFTFQMTLYSDGRIEYCYDNRVCNQGSTFGALNAIVGLSPNGAAIGAGVDLTSGPVVASSSIYEEFVTTAPLTCNPNFDLQDKTLTFVPTNPGWVVLVGALPCATTLVYGTGCGQNPGPLGLTATNPVLGSNWDFTTSNIAGPISITFFGNIQVNLPLAFLGAPGCNGHIDTILGSLSGISVGGMSTATLPLPLNATLKGAQLTAQSVCLTSTNALGLLTSNGVQGTLGF